MSSIGGILGSTQLSNSTATLGPKIQESQPGNFLNTLLKGMQGSSTTPTSTTGTAPSQDVTALRTQTTQTKLQFQRKLIQKLLEQGVDLSQPITLQGDGFGGVKVAGDHADKETIESLFENDPELRQDFQNLSAQAEQLYQLDRTALTTKDGPTSSMDGLPDQTQPQFSLILRNGDSDMAFLRGA